ncbi:MAG: hypothetical protein WC951_13690 [Bacteroidales bacterium]
MKKLVLGAAMLLFAQFSFGQVSDNAVIPVSVTLNSILRLTVVSGGNIQFVVNTIEDYQAGISNSARYTTRFNVASSRDFDVLIYSESATFAGMDYDGGTSTGFPIANIGFLVDQSAGTATVGTNNNTAVTALDVATTAILEEVSGGSSVVNVFDIQWELATAAVLGSDPNLLQQNIAPDTYVGNVFINIVPN